MCPVQTGGGDQQPQIGLASCNSSLYREGPRCEGWACCDTGDISGFNLPQCQAVCIHGYQDIRGQLQESTDLSFLLNCTPFGTTASKNDLPVGADLLRVQQDFQLLPASVSACCQVHGGPR